MAKVGIFEDSSFDAIAKYSGLIQEGHEVHVCILNPDPVSPIFKSHITTIFIEKNFHPKGLYFDSSEMPDADIYFCDSLLGKCYDIADKFGKDKTIINTGSAYLARTAKEKGYKVRETSVEEIVKQIGGSLAR